HPYSALSLIDNLPVLSEGRIFTTGTACSEHRYAHAVVLVMMGTGLFMFGIPMNVQSDAPTSAEQFTPFWLGILITASLALNIISIIGVLSALVEFSRAIVGIYHIHGYQMYENDTEEEELHMSIRDMELVFCCHSLIGGILLVTMTFFARAALRSSRTQAVVVMRNLPPAE
uniref:Si:ch1073-291c23.2 n=1 Tax=Sinocyclocheilus rhinocerous TaxID=307959 RepID=A0A673HBV9_9TELE